MLTIGNFDSELQFIPLRADLSFYLGSFYKQFHMHLFQSKSFVKIFPNFKLESNFFPQFFNLIRNIESCAPTFGGKSSTLVPTCTSTLRVSLQQKNKPETQHVQDYRRVSNKISTLGGKFYTLAEVYFVHPDIQVHPTLSRIDIVEFFPL